MIIASCPLRVSLFGGSTDNPYFVKEYGYGSVISFTSDLKTYVTLSQDKFGFNKKEHKYIINYSKREEVVCVDDIQNEVVRVVLDYFDMPPVHVMLTSDSYSQGSGLASSSSYIISLMEFVVCSMAIRCLTPTFVNWHINLRQFNPYCGYQDPYGCGIGGFKRIEFMDDYRVKYEYLPQEFLDDYDMHLIFTESLETLKNSENITCNLNKVQPMLRL